MSGTQCLSLFLVVASIAACAGPKIGYDFDPQADFRSYHTFDWIAGEQEATGDRRVDNAQFDIRIRTAVGAQLSLKGYTMKTNGKPDFYVAYHVGVKDLTPDATSQYFSKGMAGAPFSHTVDTRPKDTTPAKIDSRLAGSLLLDIIDAGTDKLVWRGTAAGDADPGLTSEERDARIRAIVHEMLSHFPPK